MKKKALALALVLCMVIAMLPVSVFAAQPQPAPTEAAAGPEIRYQPMSDAQPMAAVQVQPTETVDGYELMRILDAAYESARTGHEVTL